MNSSSIDLSEKIMIDQLEYMIKEVEVLMRGGKTETVKLIADAKAMIFYLSSSDALDFCDTLSDDQRTLYATAAVRLHNKARNLNRKQLNDIRVLLKAVSAWSILTFHTELTKKLPIVIKMLSEVEKYFCNTDEMTDLGLICCKAIIQSWDIGIENAIEKICPPLEMTELKSAVFQSYLDASIILSNHLRSNYSEVKQFTTSAMDLSQSLPRQNKLNLVYCLSQVAFKGLEAELGQEVKYFFLISLNVLDEISQPQKKIFADVEEDSFEPNMEEIDVLKIKIQLALSHIYAETK